MRTCRAIVLCFARPWLWTLILGCCWSVATLRAASLLTIGQVTVDSDGMGVVPVTLTTDLPAVAFQFDLQYEDSLLSAGSPALPPFMTNQILVANLLSNGLQRVLVYSSVNLPLPAGLVLNLQFTPRPGSAGRVIPLTVTNVIVSTATATAISPLQLIPGSFSTTSDTGARFSSISPLPTGGIELQLKATEGRTFAIQTSGNLHDWLPLTTNSIPAGGLLKVNDPASSKTGIRFYRAAQQ